MDKADLRDLFRERYAPAATPVATPPAGGRAEEPQRAFVVHAESGRTVITAPVREVAASNDTFMYLRGRLVGGDAPNRNGAMWSSSDLELSHGTVAGGPLNWLHDENRIIGCLTSGRFVSEREAAGVDTGNHIASDSTVWRFLFPGEARTIERAAADGQLFYSMECISREVACVDTPGRPGCGDQVSYGDFDAGRCCSHLRERSSVRRFVDPIFQGAAVIVPPVQPGWASASADVVREAAALSEKASLADANHLSEQQARDLATAVLGWANRV